MEILESLEVRWFLPSDAPAGPVLEKWFASIRDEGDRVDHYLATGRNELRDVLTATIRAIAAQFELPELPAAWTASYASWLLPKVAVKA